MVQRIIQIAKGDGEDLDQRALLLVHMAERPLHVNELRHALAVDIDYDQSDNNNLDQDNMPTVKMLLDSCLGIIIVDDETKIPRFVYYTLEDHFKEAGNFISNSKVSCGSYNDRIDPFFEYMHFFGYAAIYWGFTRNGEYSSYPMLYCTRVRAAAVKEGQIAVAELLIEHKVDANFISEKHGMSPLGCSVSYHNGEMVKLVLEHGANAADAPLYNHLNVWEFVIGDTPLISAATHGEEAIVDTLLDFGATVDIQNRLGQSALMQIQVNMTAQEPGPESLMPEVPVMRGDCRLLKNEGLARRAELYDQTSNSRMKRLHCPCLADNGGRTVISYSAEYGSPEDLRILADAST
ncbi:ankyrin repeat-containing domain protein [Peziza echinospora]|nr:ankyrin repeat-containing domain protein [Peziza echinospora]